MYTGGRVKQRPPSPPSQIISSKTFVQTIVDKQREEKIQKEERQYQDQINIIQKALQNAIRTQQEQIYLKLNEVMCERVEKELKKQGYYVKKDFVNGYSYLRYNYQISPRT